MKSLIHTNRDVNNGNKVFVTQMYSPKLTARINEALKYRKDIISHDNTQAMFVAYPAKLMGKTKGTKDSYKMIKEF